MSGIEKAVIGKKLRFSGKARCIELACGVLLANKVIYLLGRYILKTNADYMTNINEYIFYDKHH